MSETMRSDNFAQVSLPIEGMTCAACVAKVEKALKNLGGVQEVHVNLLSGKAAVVYASDQAGVSQMLLDVSYFAEGLRTIKINGLNN